MARTKIAKKSRSSRKRRTPTPQASSTTATGPTMPQEEQRPLLSPVAHELEKSTDGITSPDLEPSNKGTSISASQLPTQPPTTANPLPPETDEQDEQFDVGAINGSLAQILSKVTVMEEDWNNDTDFSQHSDVFSNRPKPAESVDETTNELIERGKETTKTLRYVNAFLDSTKDKHYIDVPIAPLKGRENWETWCIGIEVVLRMHQVWALFEQDIAPLDKEHEMFVWYDRMVDVAMAVIYRNVARAVRQHPCFMRSILQRDPAGMMSHLAAHYGYDGDSDEDAELDEVFYGGWLDRE